MKKTTFFSLAFVILTFVTSAQASISSPNITNWYGTGSNESAFVLQWNDGKSPGAMAWGYRWNSGSGPTLNQLIANLLSANSGIYARGDSAGPYGAGYYGFGYDTGLNNTFSVTGGLDADGNPTTISFTNGFSDMNSDNTTYQAPGSSTSAAPTNSQDRYQEGWNDNGFWELYTSTSTSTPAAWTASWDGGEQQLTNNAWYAYTFSNPDFSSNPPTLTSPPPSVTSSSISGSVGTPLTATIFASNNPTSFAVNSGNLPNGVTLNPTTGIISGTPTTAGNATSVSISATNAQGTGTGNFTFNIAKGSQTISGVATTLTKSLGSAAYSLNATTNSNLSLSYTSSKTAVATVSSNGTVTIVGNGTTTLTVSQSGNANYNPAANVTQTLIVSAAPPVVTSTTINGTVGIALSANVSATNSPSSFAAVGVLPAGLTFNSTTGSFKGTPTTAANGTTITIIAANAGGNGNGTFRFNIAKGSQTINGVAPTISKAAGSYSLNATVTSNLTLIYGSSNMSVATVAANGTVNIVGNGSTVLTVSQPGNANYEAATNVTQTLMVAPAPIITSNATATATRGSPFTYQITASNAPTSFSVTGNLTQGLSFNGTTGIISGTPTATGNSSVLLCATNAYGNGTKTLTISVANLLPTITSNNSTTATLGVPFSYQITATNAPLTGYAITGILPGGLSLSSTTGLISGIPRASGNYLLSMIARNSAGNSTAATLSIKVAPAVTFSISGPINQKVSSGSNATFSVSNAVASTPNATISYQWYKNGLAIGNATSSSYTIANLDYSTAGAYSVKVTTTVGSSTIGSVTSEAWSITPNDALSILVYTMTGNATRTAGAAESTGTIKGYFVIDRANNNAAIIQTYGSGLMARNSLETRNDIAAYSTGPVSGSRTVFAGSLNSGNSTTDHDLVWITGQDTSVTVATGKTVFAPSTMSGIIGTVAQSSAVEIDSFGIGLSLNNSLTANASSANLTSTIAAVRKAASDAGYPNEPE